ncbi:MAG: nucleotidyltransferase domain-containing protein [Actinomycetota bacterium]
MAEVLAERRREQERLVGLAREYVERLSRRFPIVGAAVVGSVARGDFNLWSDVDVVVVTEGLPDRTPERGAALGLDAPPGVQAVGFSPEEFEAAWLRRNPLAREASEIGVALVGQDFFRRRREP